MEMQWDSTAENVCQTSLNACVKTDNSRRCLYSQISRNGVMLHVGVPAPREGTRQPAQPVSLRLHGGLPSVKGGHSRAMSHHCLLVEMGGLAAWRELRPARLTFPGKPWRFTGQQGKPWAPWKRLAWPLTLSAEAGGGVGGWHLRRIIYFPVGWGCGE